MNQTANASLSGESFNASISGLNPGYTYYYKAYATVYGTGDYASQSQTFEGSVQSFTTKKVATATVTTNAATSVTSSSAVLNGQWSGASGRIYETGFYWGTSQNSLTGKVTTDGSNNASGNFSCTIGDQSPLSASTIYYFKAYVLEYNESTGQHVERLASTVQSFTTSAVPALTGWQAYLNDYGMPDVSGLGLSLRQSGTNDRDDHWYGINTSNSNRQIAIHTYADGAPNDDETLNYVVLYDGSKYAPVWTYHVMNTAYWPDNNVGRTNPDPWTEDPAISLTQQTGLDNASSVGYSRGHLVASNYRQTTTNQNKQTFYYSNQAPQWQNSFNDGVWSSLESRVKTIAPSGTSMLYVVTGVLYEGTTTTLPSGSLNVPIPSHFYKCIMKCTFSGSTVTGAQGIAFVYSNQAHITKNTGLTYYGTDTQTGNECFVTSINAIEERAGFDFFANVPAAYQDSAESNTNHSWFTGQSSPSNISSVSDTLWGSF